jgi:hypothetical protein
MLAHFHQLRNNLFFTNIRIFTPCWRGVVCRTIHNPHFISLQKYQIKLFRWQKEWNRQDYLSFGKIDY